MAEKNTVSSPIVRIGVQRKVGERLMAATADPVFLELPGEDGQEVCLRRNGGKSPRPGQEEPPRCGSSEDATAR